MSAYTDFLDLRTEVVEYVGDQSIVDVFPRLVALAEASLNRILRCRDQIRSAVLTFADGSAPLPSDFVEAIGLYDSAGREYVQQPPPAVRPLSGLRSGFAILGDTVEAVAASGDKTLQYYAKIPSVALTESNWLLAEHPAVYFWAVTLEAARWKKDAGLTETVHPFLAAEIAAANAQDFAEKYSRARVRVEGVTP